jgi:hypothetical protein
MGLGSFIVSKLLAIGCLIGCIALASVGLPMALPEYGLQLPPITFNTVVGDIALIIAFILFLAALYFFTHE